MRSYDQGSSGFEEDRSSSTWACRGELLCFQRSRDSIESVIVQSPLHATIVSRLFWPSFQQASLKLPGQLGKWVYSHSHVWMTADEPRLLRRAKSAYEQSYVRQKPDKKLRWLPQLGTINITLNLKDRSITLDVTPVQASIMVLFSQKGIFRLPHLAAQLNSRLTSLWFP